jgi:hypothetical protein
LNSDNESFCGSCPRVFVKNIKTVQLDLLQRKIEVQV